MAKIIKMPGMQSPGHEPEDIMCTDYYLCRGDGNGNEISRQQLDGSEFVVTFCPKCGKEFRLDFYEFCDIVTQGFDFYGTSIYCRECSAQRVKEQEGGNIL